MVRSHKGTLVTCDPVSRVVLLNLDKKYGFVIRDLDNTHLFIESSRLEEVKHMFEKIMDQNSYKADIKVD
ncbi:hypothetical protein H4219_003026 [Mycoemilia scoparia]|uniref:General transcription and DNA repair factor IIH subunit TFB5 n=1 Tax=Mycoemilia scoparia TaxID=417184 RepID=A0A9W8A1S0_9FUNG|nr:hypothetical protein H4219_003026 [Mycoemilia scoparia]